MGRIIASVKKFVGCNISRLIKHSAAVNLSPFKPRVPNAETIEAMKATRRGDMIVVGSVKKLMADLRADD